MPAPGRCCGRVRLPAPAAQARAFRRVGPVGRATGAPAFWAAHVAAPVRLASPGFATETRRLRGRPKWQVTGAIKG
jgi:hypothetical protein